MQTTATGILMLLAALWALALLSGWWRGHIRDRLGRQIDLTAGRLDGQVRPVWAGWAVVVGGKKAVVWRGTIWGPRTIVRAGDSTRARPGLLDADGVTDERAAL